MCPWNQHVHNFPKPAAAFFLWRVSILSGLANPVFSLYFFSRACHHYLNKLTCSFPSQRHGPVNTQGNSSPQSLKHEEAGQKIAKMFQFALKAESSTIFCTQLITQKTGW